MEIFVLPNLASRCRKPVYGSESKLVMLSYKGRWGAGGLLFKFKTPERGSRGRFDRRMTRLLLPFSSPNAFTTQPDQDQHHDLRNRSRTTRT